MNMTPLPVSQSCLSSSSTSSWRWAGAPKTLARTRSGLMVLEKNNTRLSPSPSSPKAEQANPGASPRNRYRPVLTASFKSP